MRRQIYTSSQVNGNASTPVNIYTKANALADTHGTGALPFPFLKKDTPTVVELQLKYYM